jgi:hypothetical protein
VTSPTTSPERTVSVTAFGCEVRIQIAGSRADELLEHVLDAWGWCGATPVQSGSDGLVVSALLDDDRAIIEAAAQRGEVAGDSVQAVSDRLTPAVTLAAIGATRGELLMLRAAAVAEPETGRTVVLVGGAGAGKSTAARTLSRHYGYVTDETVALTRSLDVLPYPRPVSLSPDGPRRGKVQHPPAELGLVPAPEALRPAALLFLDRQGSPTPPVLTEVPTGEALAQLGGQTSFLGSLDRPLHFLADLVHAAGGAHTVTYSNADDLVAVVEALLAEDDRPTGYGGDPRQPTLAEAYGDAIPPRTPEDTPIGCRSFTDFHLEDGVGSVMVDDRVTVLSPMATRILTLLGDGTATAKPLTEALLAEFGDPDAGDPLLLVDGLIADLIDAGLVEHVEP